MANTLFSGKHDPSKIGERGDPATSFHLIRLILTEMKKALTGTTDIVTSLPSGGSIATTAEPFVTIGNTGNLSAERALTGTPNAITVTDGGANSTVTLGIDTGFFDDPSAFVGLTPVNGSAVTAMRSDAAPPIDEAIMPVWTNSHTFGAALKLSAIATPSNPMTNYGKVFLRVNAGNLELVLRGPTGAECVMCSVSNIAYSNQLQFNLIEP